MNDLVAHVLAAGGRVAYTADWHPPSTPHFQKDGGIWPTHCVADTWGSEFHPGLTVSGPVVRKGTNGEDGYSGFWMKHPNSEERVPTELGDHLKAWQSQELIVVGLATDYCVMATALDGLTGGYPVTLFTAAIRAVNLKPNDDARALREMSEAGATLV